MKSFAYTLCVAALVPVPRSAFSFPISLIGGSRVHVAGELPFRRDSLHINNERIEICSTIFNDALTHLHATKPTLSPDDDYTFTKIKSVEDRLESIQKDAPSLLSGFYEPHLKSFSVRPGDTSRMSVTSTCFALRAIFATGDCSLFGDVVDANMQAPSGDTGDSTVAEGKSSKVPLRGVVKALLRAQWREEDMFQVPLILYTILEVDKGRSVINADMDEELRHKVRQLISATLEARPKRRSGESQPLSAYIIYLITDSLAALVESTPQKDINGGLGTLGGLPADSLPEGATTDALLALSRCVEVGYNELCRQLAFRTAGDMTSFDVTKLAYSLLTYIKASNAMSGTAGMEMNRGEGPASGTVVKPPNRMLITAALDAFFDEQEEGGCGLRGNLYSRAFVGPDEM